MKKLYLIASALLMCYAVSMAQSPVLVVDGQALDPVPVSLTFDGDNVIVHFADGESAYDMESVVIDYTTASAYDLGVQAFRCEIADKVRISGATDAPVMLYDASGHLITTVKAVGGNATIDASALPAGVYILRNDNRYVKLIKH